MTSLRGRRKKGRGRGREKSTKFSPLPPSLLPFFPIPYPFRRLLRRLIGQPWVACAFTLQCASRVSFLLGLPFSRRSLKLYNLGLRYPASRGPSIFLDKSYLGRSKCLCSQGRVGMAVLALHVQPKGFSF